MYITKLIIYFLTALRWIKNLILTLLIISFLSQFLNNLERYPTLNRLNITVNNSASFITKEIKKSFHTVIKISTFLCLFWPY